MTESTQTITEPTSRRLTGGWLVAFPLKVNSTATIKYLRCEIHQQINEHDTAVIRISSTKLDWIKSMRPGTPITVTYWGTPSTRAGWREGLNFRVNIFYGYVNSVRLISDAEGTYIRELICVAASRVFRKTEQRTFTDMSAAEIVKQIGAQFNFRVVTEQHGLRKGTVIQSGESNWKLMTRLAKQTGYTLRVEATTIYFLPIRSMIVGKIYNRPIVFRDYSFGEDRPNVESIDSWVGDTSDDPDNLTYTAQATFVDPMTGETQTESSTPDSMFTGGMRSKGAYIANVKNQTFFSRKEAALAAKGQADRGLMAIDVKMTVVGDPWIDPYRPARLELKDRNLSGYWLVKEVTHVFTKGDNASYVSNVVVSTDAVTGFSKYPRVMNSSNRDYGSELTKSFYNDDFTNTRLFVLKTEYVEGDSLYAYWVNYLTLQT